MKKLLTVLIIFALVFNIAGISYANKGLTENLLLGIYTFLLDNVTMTNPDPNQDTIYALITGITVDNVSDDINSGFSTLEFVIDLEEDLSQYHVKDIYPYSPNIVDFETTPNLIRPITKYSETQKEFNNFYYNPIYSDPSYLWGFEGEVAKTYLHGFFEAGFKADYKTYNLDKILKMPGGEQRVLDAFPIKNENMLKVFKDIIAKNGPHLDEDFTSYLYTQSVIFELEKKAGTSTDDPMGYSGVWKSSTDTGDYWTLIIHTSEKHKDKYYAALNYTGGWGGIISHGYIDFKEGKQYLSKHLEWEYYEDEPYPTFYIELKDGQVNMSTDHPFSISHGNKMTFDLVDKDLGVWKGLESSMDYMDN